MADLCFNRHTRTEEKTNFKEKQWNFSLSLSVSVQVPFNTLTHSFCCIFSFFFISFSIYYNLADHLWCTQAIIKIIFSFDWTVAGTVAFSTVDNGFNSCGLWQHIQNFICDFSFVFNVRSSTSSSSSSCARTVKSKVYLRSQQAQHFRGCRLFWSTKLFTKLALAHRTRSLDQSSADGFFDLFWFYVRVQSAKIMELRVGNKYRLGRKIGSGSFGDIYLGTTINTGEEVITWK